MTAFLVKPSARTHKLEPFFKWEGEHRLRPPPGGDVPPGRDVPAKRMSCPAGVPSPLKKRQVGAWVAAGHGYAPASGRLPPLCSSFTWEGEHRLRPPPGGDVPPGRDVPAKGMQVGMCHDVLLKWKKV